MDARDNEWQHKLAVSEWFDGQHINEVISGCYIIYRRWARPGPHMAQYYSYNSENNNKTKMQFANKLSKSYIFCRNFYCYLFIYFSIFA